MLQFLIDQSDPLGALEDCGTQLNFLVDVLSQGEAHGVEFGDIGAAGFADLLRAISKAVDTISEVIRRVYPAGLEIIQHDEGAPSEEPDEALPQTRSERLALITRLLAEDADASEILAGRASAAGGAGSPASAPRLTEPRTPTRQRRAA